MKLLLFILLLTVGSCANLNSSKSRCDKKVGVEKEQCIESYKNFVRNLEYREFRGGGRGKY